MTAVQTPFSTVDAVTPVLTLGWREWVALPDLGIPAVKAKLDTGARTSALHAFRIEPFRRDGIELVRFWLHPLRRNRGIEQVCETRLVDRRNVRDSGGHTERRYVIETAVRAAHRQWNIEITLTDRENMLFRMLLGRNALLGGHIVVDPSLSYVTGRAAGRVYARKNGGK